MFSNNVIKLSSSNCKLLSNFEWDRDRKCDRPQFLVRNAGTQVLWTCCDFRSGQACVFPPARLSWKRPFVKVLLSDKIRLRSVIFGGSRREASVFAVRGICCQEYVWLSCLASVDLTQRLAFSVWNKNSKQMIELLQNKPISRMRETRNRWSRTCCTCFEELLAQRHRRAMRRHFSFNTYADKGELND